MSTVQKKGVLAALFIYMLNIVPLYAEMLAENAAFYTDKKTGITVVIADVVLTGNYQLDEIKTPAPVEQLMVFNRKLANEEANDKLAEDPLLEEANNKLAEDPLLEEANNKLAEDPLSRAVNMRSLWKNGKQYYQFGGIVRDVNATEMLITFRHHDKNSTQTVRLDLKAAKKNSAPREHFLSWIENRHKDCHQLSNPNIPNLIYDIWVERSKAIYGVSIMNPYYDYNQRGNNSDNKGFDALSIFGGQTAIRETLQTQLLAKDGDKNISPEIFVDIDSIQGVEVKAHPYATMLETLNRGQKTEAGIQSTLANYIPNDRLMILIREPKEIAGLLSADNDLFARLAPMLGSGFADYALFERYTARFGLTPDQLRAWFSGENVKEIALFAPDVFFLDSTDLTAVILLKPSASIPFKMAKKITGILPVTLPHGETFYIASRDDLLFVSSRKTELEKSLVLADKKGAGSLGASAEFQVMQHKLPMDITSRAYLYFSDPFIRRLTSPEIKIGQLRRAIARNTMETITAMALLYRLDHGVDADLAMLVARGYLTDIEAPSDEYKLEAGSRVVSKTWGALDQLTPLTGNPIMEVTQNEADNYIAYRNRYSQYWQAYFDPIAVRADSTEKGGFALETFILPLIDNSIYNMLKETVGVKIPEKTEVPLYSQTPIASLAFNLPKEEASRFLNSFYALRYILAPFLPLLGNTAVLSIQDSDPVVQSNFPGLGTFNSQNDLFFGVRGRDLLAVPIVGALFTRPVDFAIQITDEENVREELRALYLSNERYSYIEKTYWESDNRLILDWTLLGVIRMEFSITIENGWLHISNHPWTPVSIVGTQSLPPNHAAVLLRPSMLKKALPQILGLAQSAYRQSIYASASELLPWMKAYHIDAPSAVTVQKKALGKGTPLPAEVSFENDSSKAKPYGRWSYQEMPASTEQNAELIKLFQDLNLWLRFEEEGLRSRIEFIVNEIKPSS